MSNAVTNLPQSDRAENPFERARELNLELRYRELEDFQLQRLMLANYLRDHDLDLRNCDGLADSDGLLDCVLYLRNQLIAWCEK